MSHMFLSRFFQFVKHKQNVKVDFWKDASFLILLCWVFNNSFIKCSFLKKVCVFFLFYSYQCSLLILNAFFPLLIQSLAVIWNISTQLTKVYNTEGKKVSTVIVEKWYKELTFWVKNLQKVFERFLTKTQTLQTMQTAYHIKDKNHTDIWYI